MVLHVRWHAHSHALGRSASCSLIVSYMLHVCIDIQAAPHAYIKLIIGQGTFSANACQTMSRTMGGPWVWQHATHPTHTHEATPVPSGGALACRSEMHLASVLMLVDDHVSMAGAFASVVRDALPTSSRRHRRTAVTARLRGMRGARKARMKVHAERDTENHDGGTSEHKFKCEGHRKAGLMALSSSYNLLTATPAKLSRQSEHKYAMRANALSCCPVPSNAPHCKYTASRRKQAKH